MTMDKQPPQPAGVEPSVDPQSSEPEGPAFLGVFVVRSFRESHLAAVLEIIKEEVASFSSPRWGDKRYYLIDTEQDIAGGSFLLDEIARQIANAALTIVILDGLRLNVLFELGLLYGFNRPFVVLRHRRWGPPFHELDLLASDLKGVVIKNFDHEKEGDDFRKLLRAELARCDEQFVANLGGHLLVPSTRDNLIVNQGWRFERENLGNKGEDSIVLPSFKYAELHIVRHVSPTSLFVLGFNLESAHSAATAYLHMGVRRGGREFAVWVGYSSGTLLGRDEPTEITIPLIVSGPGTFTLVDNIQRMVSQRLGLADVDGLLVDTVRLRGHDDAVTKFSEVRITD